MYSFSYLEPVYCSMSSSNCCFLTCIQVSQRQVRWSDIPISKNVPQFIVIHRVKGFGIVNKAEIDVFLELSWAPKYIKQMLKGIKGETDGKTITVGDFNTPLTSVDHILSDNSALLTMPKPLTVWITINCGKF